jgi:hypothetical protein
MKRRFRVLAAACALSLALLNGRGIARAGIEPPPPPEIIPQDTMSAQFTLIQVLTAGQVQQSWFTEAFVKAEPLPQIQSLIDRTRATLGTFISLRPNGDHYDARFTKGRAKVKMFMVGPQIDNLEIYDPVTKATDDGAYRLSQIFQANPIPDVLFSQTFLIEFPITRVQSTVAGMKRQYGSYRSLTITGDETYLVQFERGATVAKLHLDENQRVDGMSFETPAAIAPAKS